MPTTTIVVEDEWVEVLSGKGIVTPCLSEQGFTSEELPLNSLPDSSRFFVHFGSSLPDQDTKDYHVVPGGCINNGTENMYMRCEFPEAYQWFAATTYSTPD